MIFALGACARMSVSIVLRLPGNVVLTYCWAAATALSHVLVEPRTQVSRTEEKPASLPPAVTLTRVVEELSADSWLLMTSLVVAPLHATKVNDAGELAAAHRAA